MILSKGYITKLPDTGTNIFTVRVPLMEDNTLTQSSFTAVLSGPPESYGGYKVGDCVIVHFEGDEYINAVILGKLYTGSTDCAGKVQAESLVVSNSAVLPEDTRFGDYSVASITALFNGLTTAGGGINNTIVNNVENDVDLSPYVQWEDTKSSAGKSNYANNIKTLTGEEYSALEEIDDNTLYFLSSAPVGGK